MKYNYLAHILAPIIAAVIINAYIYLQGWNNKTNNKLLPPGYVIAIVWIIILGLLGYAHYLVFPSIASAIIAIGIFYCLIYPFLTNSKSKVTQNTNKAYIYNLLALIIAIIVTITSYMQNKKTIYYTILFVLWTAYVNIVTNI